MCLHIRKWSRVFSLAPSHPRQTWFGQCLTTKLKWSKISIPSWNYLKFVITLATLFYFWISTCEPIVSNIWWTKNDKCKNCIAYITRQPKRFLIFISCKYNYQKIHKAFIFPMKTFLTLTSISMQWQPIHYMIWRLQKLIFASSFTTKEPLLTYNAMPRIPHAWVGKKLWNKKCPRCISLDTQCFLWSLNSSFGQTHKFTILFIIFIPYYIKVNVMIVNAIKSCYVFVITIKTPQRQQQNERDEKI